MGTASASVLSKRTRVSVEQRDSPLAPSYRASPDFSVGIINNIEAEVAAESGAANLDMRSPPSGWSGGCSYSRGWHLERRKRKKKEEMK